MKTRKTRLSFFFVVLLLAFPGESQSEKNPTGGPHPVITSPLEIIPPFNVFRVGDDLTALFDITNKGINPVILKVLTVGGRDPYGRVVDFDWKENIRLNPNDTFSYVGDLTLPKQTGNYYLFCTYQTEDGNWNTSVDLGPGLTDKDRIKRIDLTDQPVLGQGGDFVFEAVNMGLEGCKNLSKIVEQILMQEKSKVNVDEHWKVSLLNHAVVTARKIQTQQWPPKDPVREGTLTETQNFWVTVGNTIADLLSRAIRIGGLPPGTGEALKQYGFDIAEAWYLKDVHYVNYNDPSTGNFYILYRSDTEGVTATYKAPAQRDLGEIIIITPVQSRWVYNLQNIRRKELFLPDQQSYKITARERLIIICPDQEGLGTALVIDRSGSMRGEKLKRAQQAAYVYVDTSAENEDVASVVAFASSASTITQPVSIKIGRETLKQNILSVASGGNTNVGAGLAIAFDHLSLSSKQKKTAVLLSDGRNNSGSYEPEVAKFKKQGWPISTVAFGSDADQNMLSQIAYETGGSFFPAGSFDISRVYHKINVQAHNGSVLRSYSEFVKPDKQLYYDVPVQDDMKKIGFFTNWQGSRMETKVVSPSGTDINKRNCNKYGKYIEAETHSLLEIDNPESGDWKVEIVGHDLPKKGEQVNFHCYCESGIVSNILGFQPSYSQNQKVTIGVKLCEIVSGRLKPLKNAHVTAEVKKPTIYAEKKGKTVEINVDLFGIIKDVSGIGKKVTLFDDGRHEDVEAGDGIYANTYKDTASKGPHLVTIDCEVHNSEGKLFKRRLQESFQVGAIEQNAFTISEFLRLLTPTISSGQTRATRTKKREEQKDKGPLESVFDLFKKK